MLTSWYCQPPNYLCWKPAHSKYALEFAICNLNRSTVGRKFCVGVSVSKRRGACSTARSFGSGSAALQRLAIAEGGTSYFWDRMGALIPLEACPLSSTLFESNRWWGLESRAVYCKLEHTFLWDVMEQPQQKLRGQCNLRILEVDIFTGVLLAILCGDV